MDKKTYTTSEVAKMLGISRIAVFRKIKSGEIKARKAGRNFVIEEGNIAGICGTALTEEGKKKIERSVERTIKEYGETLKLLGKE